MKLILAFLTQPFRRYSDAADQVLGYMDALDEAVSEGSMAQVHIVAANLRLTLLHIPIIAAVNRVRKTR